MTNTTQTKNLVYAIDVAIKTLQRRAEANELMEMPEFVKLQNILIDYQARIYESLDLSDETSKRFKFIACNHPRAATTLPAKKVYPDAVGNIIITDPIVLDLYKFHSCVKIDRETGTPLFPPNKLLCNGNGEHEGYLKCCDHCEFRKDCSQA